MKIHKDKFKMDNQIDVYSFYCKYVTGEHRVDFIRAFCNWDNSLYGVHPVDYPSYSEGVCWQMLNEAYGN